ncbi:DUF3313 family protein [Photobacterium leiognathi]|uniref:DUF3313 family protein n=2 Tax=Photobacterium leiognathi TaxID=553611 RepID=UPI002733608B|nr:DUF3313 family protein [Photobacterium leiognathi]
MMLVKWCVIFLIVGLQTGCAFFPRDVAINVEGKSTLHLTPQDYDKLYISPVQVTQASDRQVSKRIVSRLERSIHDDLHTKFSDSIKVVESVDDRTLQLDVALAKVHTSLEDMSIGELFPYRAALEGMILVLGERDRDVHIAAQYRLKDANTQELLAERETLFTLEAVLENDEAHLQYHELQSLKPKIQQDIVLFATQVAASHIHTQTTDSKTP